MRTIRSQNDHVDTYDINTVSLSRYDDKKFIKDDGISTYAYGQYAIDN